MKLEKEDLIKKVNELEIDEDVKIALMEDITDSFETIDTTEYETEKSRLEEEIKDLKNRYKERFLKGSEEKVEEKEDEEIEEKTIVDVKEI